MLAQVSTGLASTSDGATKVSAGASGVHEGLQQLSAGAAQLNAGADRLSGAASELASGSSQLAAAVPELDTGAKGLAQGAKELDAGATRLAGGAQQIGAAQGQVDQLAAGARQLATGIGQLSAGASDGIPRLVAGVGQLDDAMSNPDPHRGLVAGAKAISGGADQLAQGTAQLDNGASQLQAGTGQLATGVGALADGGHRLNGGVGQLDAKIPALVDGVRALDNGAAQLATGTSTLQGGTATLATKTPGLVDGLSQLEKGSGTLARSLADGRDKIPADSDAQRSARTDAVVTPVGLESTNLHEAESWGEGFAPFFIALGLWVGALVTWLLLRPLSTRALMTSVNGFRMAWGALNPALLIAAGQVFIMLTVMHFAVGLNPQNVIATILFTYLTAAAFFALQQFFQVSLGSAVGKVVIISLLMVQLASAGGTYPVETEPAFFQAVSPWMPITHVVEGLRLAITGDLGARFWTACAILGGIFLVSLALTSLVSARKRIWSLSRLHPVLEI